MSARGAGGREPAQQSASGPAPIERPGAQQGRADGHQRVDILVIGGGLSGLATGFWLRRLTPRLTVRVLEASDQPGGKVRTLHEDGFQVDTGPGSLTLGATATDELVDALGLTEWLVASPRAGRRFLVRHGRLVPLPSKPSEVITSPLVSMPGKLRALMEPLVGRGGAPDESVHGILARRFGGEVATGLGQALVSGIVAGDPRELSVAAVLPQLAALERRYGSVLRGMVAAARGGGSPARRTVAIRGGMGSLTSALAGSLGALLVTGEGVDALARVAGGYEVRSSRGRQIEASEVVLATPADVTGRLLEPLAPELTRELSGIPYVAVDVVALGYRLADVPRHLDGFGFLAARGEGVRSLGVMYASALSPDAAPEGSVLFRAICGGALDPEFASLTETEKVREVRHDLRTTLSITANPSFERVVAWHQAIPQYLTTHLERVRRIDAAVAGHPGIHLAGNAYRGVGVTDCLREARALAERLAVGAQDGVASR